MYRAQPQASKLLNKKWHSENQQRHEQRLKSMKPTYSIKPPLQYKHLKTKPKRNQMLEGTITSFKISNFLERYFEIERENRILLDKMTNILSTSLSRVNNQQSHISSAPELQTNNH